MKPASPAIDAGAYDGVYDTFLALYGLEIDLDFDEDLRPQGNGFDLGAYED